MNTTEKTQILRDKLRGRSSKMFSQVNEYYKGKLTTIYSLWGNIYENGKRPLKVSAIIGYKNITLNFGDNVVMTFNYDFVGIKNYLYFINDTMGEYTKLQTEYYEEVA